MVGERSLQSGGGIREGRCGKDGKVSFVTVIKHKKWGVLSSQTVRW